MDSLSSHLPSAVRVGHRTTSETVRGTYTTTSFLGQKRAFSETLERSGIPQTNLALPDDAKKLSVTDFVRPTTTSNVKRLKASIITDCGSSSQSNHLSVYSQRRAIAATPTPAAEPLLSLTHVAYGLPDRLVQNFSSVGINSIYPWQSKCLLANDLINGEGNLVYTAPTGGGKSLVADVLMLKKVIKEPGKKAILVLPFVALVQEKLRWLRRVVEGVVKERQPDKYQEQTSIWRKRGDEDSVRIVGFIGGIRNRASWADMDIAVCTIEKANALVNTAIEECTVSNLGVVVMDELHMLDDDQRGYLLELMATKLLSLEQRIQIIGMSATLPNAELLARWLNAKFYISKYRPIPVDEFLVFENTVYPASTSSRFYKTVSQLNSQKDFCSQKIPQPCRTISVSDHRELSSSLMNAVVALALETACAGYGALIFCNSRAGCESDAQLISQTMPTDIPIELMGKRRDVLSDLRSTTTGLDHTLERTIPYGVGFHHAGLTAEEREIIANAYDAGILKVMVATCSLSAGINLPARRVILHGARMGRDFVAPAMLRQMRGRAGRKGKDEIGETYLCCQKEDIEAVAELMDADLPNVTSCLSPEKRGIDRALLEVITTGLATSELAIAEYVKKTLLCHSIAQDELVQLIKSTLDDLVSNGMIKSDLTSSFEPTLLGKAIVASSLTPEDGLFVHKQLQNAVKAFVLDGEMHVLYTFTPVQSAHGDINWQIFRKEMESLDESGMRVLTLLGIKPAMVNKLAQGRLLKEATAADVEMSRIYKRMYVAFQLRDLCNEMPVYNVARKYDIPRGAVQTLSQTCHGFAAGMVKFCERMGWGALAAALDHMSDRLKAGARSDLLALAQITYIKSRTARTFWENGYKSVGDVAAANVRDLVPILLLAQPKKLRLHPDDEHKFQQKMLLKAEVISNSANRIWERLMRQELEEE